MIKKKARCKYKMLLAITGLHASGKSYFANNIPPKYGFKVYNKKDIVKHICKKETGREDWNEWYKEEFNKNAENMTRKIISYININENIVLDAVHSDLEWSIISNLVPNSELVGIITPELIRKSRQEEGDEEKDKKRIKYWHNGGGCLLANLSWCFNGGASIEINERMFEEFLEYIDKKHQSLQGIRIEFNESKTERLEKLIAEYEVLNKKIANAKELLNKYEELLLVKGNERIE